MKIKKVIIASLLSAYILGLSACGNKDIFGSEYTFNNAEIQLLDGTVVKGKVKQWYRGDKSDTIRVTFEDGKVYLTHASRVVLYNE